MERTFLLLWNPRKWAWKDLAGAVEQIAAAGIWTDTWSVGNRSDLPVGSRVYVMRVGEDPKGLVGSGWSTSLPDLATHWDPARAASGHRILKINIEFDFLREQPLVGILELALPPFDTLPTWTPQSSGMELPPTLASALHDLWLTRTASIAASDQIPDDVAHYGFPEGALRKVVVNAYERDPRARRACIRHYGATCQVCAFSFEAVYGPALADFVHVHHLTPVSELGENYILDPIRDLRPVCANCHAALHHRRSQYSIDELKELMSKRRASA